MKNIRFLKRAIIFALVLITLSIFVYSETKIGIINSQRLISESKIGKAISGKLEKLGKDKQKKVQEMQAFIKKLEKELASPALNSATIEKKSMDLQNKKTEFKRFVEDAQKEMQIFNQREMKTLQAKILPLINELGKSKGYTLIIDINVRVYHDPSIDVTDDLIRMMDSKLTPGK
jgi:outer membrane protein